MMMDKSNRELSRALRRARKERRFALARGFLSVMFTWLILNLLVYIMLQSLLPDWKYLPLLAFSLFWASAAACLFVSVGPPFFRPAGGKKMAWVLDEKAGRDRNLYRAAYEFAFTDRGRAGYSRKLMEKAVASAALKLKGDMGERPFLAEGRPGWLLASALLGLILVMVLPVLPGGIPEYVRSISNPGISFRSRVEANVISRSRDVVVPEGGSVDLEGVRFGSRKQEVYLNTSAVDGIWNREKLMPESFLENGLSLVRYRKEAENAASGFRYFFGWKGGSSDTFEVRVVYRPVINRAWAILDYPAYTSMKRDTLDAVAGGLSVPVSTRVTILGETSKRIKEGVVEFSSGGSVPVVRSPRGFRVSFTAMRGDTLLISVKDSAGYISRRPVRCAIRVIEDNPPRIKILAPEEGAHLSRSLVTDIYYRAADDYSVSRVNLLFKEEDEDEFSSAAVRPPDGEEAPALEEVFEWSLEGVGLMPGDRVLYYMEAYDNNEVTGPGYARTPVRSVKVPSLSEMYARRRKSEELQKRGMEELYQRGRQIKEDLANISERIRAEGKLDWARRREGRKLLERYRVMRDRTAEAADELRKTLESIEDNMTASMEVGRKLERIRDILSRMENDRLRGLIDKMKRILSELPEDEVSSAMEDLEFSTREMLEELDRTIDFLQQVAREERLEGMIRRMEEMLERQRALRDSTASKDMKKHSADQERLGREAGELKEDLQEFARKEKDEVKGMDEMAERMKRAGVESAMKNAARSMREGLRDSAMCSQSEALDGLLSLYTCAGKCQAGMNISLGDKAKRAVERAIHELVEVSGMQEEITIELGSARGGSPGETARKQTMAKEAAGMVAEELYGISRETMFGSRMVFTHLGLAMRGMETVLTRMERRRAGPPAREASLSALRDLNTVVIELLKSTSSSGGSGEGAGKRMRTMLEQQMGIDDSIRRMLESGNRAGLSVRERAEMARMAARQRKVSELMRQIEKESRAEDELLGEIEGVASQMDSVARGLEKGVLDSDIVETEQRILSRMLQAQRSINRRDYKRERVSGTSGFTWGGEKAGLPGAESEKEALLEMIRRGMRARGPREYRELIRLYFRALSNEVREDVE